MGACASKFKDSKDATADEAPAPPAKEEAAAPAVLAQREVNLEEKVDKDDVPAAAAEAEAAGGEAKSQSLGRLFEEEVKQEVPTEEKKKVESGGGLETDEKRADDLKPASEAVENEAPQAEAGEKLAETPQIEPSEEEVKTAKIGRADENQADQVSGLDKKCETLEADKKTEEPSPVLEEEKKEIEEKLAQISIIEEQKPASDEENKKVEEKQAETTKNEEQKPAFDEEKEKVEEKQTETTKIEEQKPVSDEGKQEVAEKPVEIMATEEQKPTSEEKKEGTEEKHIEVEIQTPASGVEEKTEEKLAQNANNEQPVDEIEDKKVVEPLKAENAAENKPNEKFETPETKSEEQARVSDGDTAKTGEERAEDK
ncbi:Unknown protein [Striga hermonthica]|uniref:Uncharacterized protein n=1 Tax=Striga hermonthica TaxID=68872 RepID=A0A9N7N8Z0_STRHE|nr:Unknown protein [Striga hermonthica]